MVKVKIGVMIGLRGKMVCRRLLRKMGVRRRALRRPRLNSWVRGQSGSGSLEGCQLSVPVLNGVVYWENRAFRLAFKCVRHQFEVSNDGCDVKTGREASTAGVFHHQEGSLEGFCVGQESQIMEKGVTVNMRSAVIVTGMSRE